MPRKPESTGGEGEDFTMNELDLDKRLSVQDCEDTIMTEKGEGTNDAMASD
jgi:hypothetical protein